MSQCRLNPLLQTPGCENQLRVYVEGVGAAKCMTVSNHMGAKKFLICIQPAKPLPVFILNMW